MSVADGIPDLARLLDGTSISLLSLTEGGETVTLRRDVGIPASIAAPAAERHVDAPCAGVFLRRHPLRTECLCEPGAVVAAGAVLGLLKIGPLLVEIRAPDAGTLSEVAAEDEALVGFGTPLFRFSPERGAP